jgi:hypothetical protein
VSPPAITIRIALEAAPVIYRDFSNEGEERRMLDWINAHPAYAALIRRALELAERERAV